MKAFGNSSGKVCHYRTIVPHPKQPLWEIKKPTGIGFQRDIYTETTLEGESDKLEQFFHANFEEPYKIAIQKVISQDQLTPNDWKSLAHFVLAQDLRTPFRILEDKGLCFQLALSICSIP